jgi:ABC-2 type transport system ATP-binding protein
MSEMALTADHLVVIGQGRLLADTSMADFIRQNSRSYVRIRTPQRERLLDALHAVGVMVVETGNGALEVDGGKAEQIGELAAQHQIVLHELSPQQASLEEAFMRLTAESVEYHAHDTTPTTPAPAPATAPAPVPEWGSSWNREG